jgi:hypothetical protein
MTSIGILWTNTASLKCTAAFENTIDQISTTELQEGFLKEFGLTLRIYDGRSFADPTQTLGQVRKKKGSGKALSVAKNMKVGNLEDKFEEEFGLKVQVAGSDDSYLCKDELTLNAAQQEDEKKLARKDRKAARQEAAGDDGDGDTTDMPKDSQNMLHLGFYIKEANLNLFELAPLSSEELDAIINNISQIKTLHSNGMSAGDISETLNINITQIHSILSLTSDGKKLLYLNRNSKNLDTDPNDPRFVEMKNILGKNIFSEYLIENAEELLLVGLLLQKFKRCR